MKIPQFIQEYRFINIILATSSILTIGYIDLITGVEMAFSLFYILPIVLLALHPKVKSLEIIICALLAAISWSYCEYSNIKLSHIFFPIWNSLVRLTIYTTIGLLFFKFKEKDRRIRVANKKLEELNTEKNKFIGIAAHDLANPIGAIYSFTDLLIQSNADDINEEINEGLHIIKELSSNTLGVLKNLLNVSVIESGKIDLKIENHDYIDFIRKQVKFNQIVASKKNIEIVLDTEIEAFPYMFDNHYLSEVTGNLLSNAIKYSYNGSLIKVRIIMQNDFILTEVIDQGKGIPDQEQQKLFYYFQKTSTQPTEGESSTGLGLAIAKQIVDLHNGIIGMKSAPNEGSTFYFKLPKVTFN
ncbi:sensor histidine kinase [Flavobacterium faecale]|uniref:sensor histidine kinase n=1 Tax=Flavobacterium faecale TaxID=1355330 RepID=UPI003AAF7154